MKVDKEQKRLNAIKLKYVLFPTECACCGNEYKREKMWQVNRYSSLQQSYKLHYCQNCMHSAEKVLYEVDTDEAPGGIVGVDDRDHFKKKDYTRMRRAREKMTKIFESGKAQ